MRKFFCGRSALFAVLVSAIASAAYSQEPPDTQTNSSVASGSTSASPQSLQYGQVQQRLARGWNTWDVHSVTTQVLLPEGLAIHVGMKHNSTLNGDAYLGDALIGRLDKDAEQVTPGPHSWELSEGAPDK